MESCLYISQSNEICSEKRSGRQRLIPLTSEIKRAMADFSDSQPKVSMPEKPFYITYSITSLVREEVHNVLKELNISDQFIHKEDIDDLIEKCLKDKVTVAQNDDGKGTTPGGWDSDRDIQVTVEMLNENDKNKLIVENFQIFEQRITNLEEQLSQLLKIMPKIKLFKTKQLKCNAEKIQDELKQFIHTLEAVQETVNSATLTDGTNTEATINDGSSQNRKPEIYPNPYDQLYYEQREHEFNTLTYIKSDFSFELNKHILFDPRIEPFIDINSINFKPFKHSKFLCNNE